MKTIILEKPGSLSMTDTVAPSQPGPEEALIRIHRIGICGTDMHAYRGRQPFFTYPRVLGHELGVEILEINSKTSPLKVGDRCSVEPYLNCGTCIACRRGKGNCCIQMQVLGVHSDGGMRERMIVPVRKLHKSTKLTFDQLALVETLGIGAHAVDRAQIIPDDTVLIVGAGPIGLSVVEFAKIATSNVVVLDMNQKRLDFCQKQMGIQNVIKIGEDPAQQIQAVLNGELPTVVFDATGNKDSMAKTFDWVAHGGKLIFVGLFQGDVTFHDPLFHRKELTLMGSRNARSDDFQKIISLMENGRVDTRPWITHKSSLQNMIGEFQGWLDPEKGVLKAMVEV